ncbi:MAG: DNA-3-methyladenine glycosylase [Gammaproteobacteria bacterium]|nr:DNA-3-methyladenine glycosylase [Gammaproteobacteria bacterium]
MLTTTFFDRDACDVARSLLGKIIRHKHNGIWLSARIIETEAYYMHERGSHASLGCTDSRKALFMPAGTIYMYYARGGDSLNVSCRGEGNAVLIKSAYADVDIQTHPQSITTMQQLNPAAAGDDRKIERLCSGQTLLCRSLNLKVPAWNQQSFKKQRFYFDDAGITPSQIIQTTRLGIPEGRDEHLLYRFIDYELTRYCTSNPLTKRGWQEGTKYTVLKTQDL